LRRYNLAALRDAGMTLEEEAAATGAPATRHDAATGAPSYIPADVIRIADGRGLHSLTSQLNLRTFGSTSLTSELNLSTFGPYPRVNSGCMGYKFSLC
jgi:hypothetical protein